MNRLNMTFCDPRALLPAPWNPNQMDAVNFQKLINSIERLTFNNPVKVRELEDGTLQIVGGEHRTKAAIELGYEEIPIINLGKISDKVAKQILLADNEHYGENDADRLAELLKSDMGDLEEILAILPFDEDQMEGYFAHDVGMDDFDFDKIGEEMDDLDLSPAGGKPKSHQIIRFKVSMEDAARISELITRAKHDQGFDGDDELTNAGDSLVHLLLGSRANE